MRYAAALSNAGASGDPRTLADLAELAESAGWDAIFLEDYIIHNMADGQLPTYDPWVALAAMATRTTRLRLGTLVTALPRRRPWKLAREVLTLDHLSGGRVTLGVGLGDAKTDRSFTKFGEPLDLTMRAEMADEALEIIAGLWTAKPFSYVGKHYRVEEMSFFPAAVQQPRIPIWVGGTWPRSGKRAYRRAFAFDGFAGFRGLPGNDDHARLNAEDVAQIRAAATSARCLASFDIVVGGWPRGADLQRERENRAECERAGATWWQEWVVGGLEQVRAIIRGGPLRTG
jgi:alkanesulfonate monooxygenase SsuD/methylene tetrahydromethanopterin reductase-like flavin-dependent oxidoreductase (luciferase family)